MKAAPQALAARIRASTSQKPVEAALSTDEQVLARITDGIYRQPASALRELISNAYDADATEVVIQTDAPRFAQVSIRDNGRGLSPEVLGHLVGHIGGSVKRSQEGKDLGVTSKEDRFLSPGGRQLIGKLGIGLFSVAQFTRHFLIISKEANDPYRTIADIILGAVDGQQKSVQSSNGGHPQFETGLASIWRERSAEKGSHGTEIKLLDLLPRTRAELASDDLWMKIDFEKEDNESEKSEPPPWHIGRMDPKQSELLEVQPRLPWVDDDPPDIRFRKLIGAVRDAATNTDSVDLDRLFDRYLQTIWTLALSAPLEYVECHPFDLTVDDGLLFFELENRVRGQARALNLEKSKSVRAALRLKTPNGAPGDRFDVFIDGIQLFRPILFRDLPKSSTAVTSSLLFVGRDDQRFAGKPKELSGGSLVFEAYLFWSPRIIPKQHQGVVLRVGNASGALFDRTFMGYQVSEQTRTRQITAEVFVHTGLDGAINIDRESFNYAHPHYQYLVKWLHSALRQLANRHKEIGSEARTRKLTAQGKRVREKIEEKVESALKARGVEDVPDVTLIDSSRESDIRKLRSEGSIALRKDAVMPPSSARRTTSAGAEGRRLAEKKAVAIVQLLHGWGLVEDLSFDEQEKLVRNILEIVLLEE